MLRDEDFAVLDGDAVDEDAAGEIGDGIGPEDLAGGFADAGEGSAGEGSDTNPERG